MSLLFNMLSRFVIALLPRSKCLFKCPYIMRLLFKLSVFYDIAPAAKGRAPLTTASRNRSPRPRLASDDTWHEVRPPRYCCMGVIFSPTHSLHRQCGRRGFCYCFKIVEGLTLHSDSSVIPSEVMGRGTLSLAGEGGSLTFRPSSLTIAVI